MKKILSTSFTALGLGVTLTAWSAPAGILLFTQPGSQIFDAKGQSRPAKQGDALQPGERLITPPGGISQVRLPDGSLVGLRPASEIKFDGPKATSDNAPNALSLVKGAARIIGTELMDGKKVSSFSFQSGPATLKLQGADLETAVVKPDDGKPAGGVDPGSYNRLLVGTASVGNGAQVETLAPRQVSFVSTTALAPIKLTSVSPTLFSPTVTLLSSPAINPSTSPLLTSPSSPSLAALSPSFTTSTLTTPLLTTTVSPIVTSPALTSIVTPGPATVLQPIGVTASPALAIVTAPIVTLAPPKVIPVYIAPVYIPPVITTTVKCTLTATGLRVCH
jgi:hypothetical protein